VSTYDSLLAPVESLVVRRASLATVEHGKGTKSSEALHQNRIGIDLADTKKDNSRRLSALALTTVYHKLAPPMWS
jgi:hypothetical protein